MSRFLVFIASISLAFLAISSTCVASPSNWDSASGANSISLSSGDSYVALPSSEAPSRIIAGGLLSL